MTPDEDIPTDNQPTILVEQAGHLFGNPLGNSSGYGNGHTNNDRSGDGDGSGPLMIIGGNMDGRYLPK